MKTGDTAPHVLYLQSTAGANQSYADKTAFTGAGWDITWYDEDGAALVTQPTWTFTNLGSGGRHLISTVVPAGLAVAIVTVPAGMVDPGTWGTEGSTFDEDDFAGLVLTSQGIPGVQSAADNDLGDVVDGDSWNGGIGLTIPLGKLTPFGFDYADLVDPTFTISAGAKSDPADTSVAIDAAFGATVTADGAFTISWDTFPTAMALTGTERSKQWYIDVQLTNTDTDQIITTNRYTINVVWDRNPPAGP